MRQRISRITLAAVFLLPAPTGSQSQGRWGAIAYLISGGHYWSVGISVNQEQQPDAEWEAKRECAPNDPETCRLELILEDECGAAAVSEVPELIYMGFGKAGDELTARNLALADCRDSGGPTCAIEVSGCSGGRAAPDFLRDGPDCKDQPEGSQCWTELANQPGCYVWNPHRQPPETATWTGGCSSGLAEGPGTLTWEWPPNNRQEHNGTMRRGRHHGDSVQRFENGNVGEGPYVNGERNGHWVWRYSDGGMAEGANVNGERSGHWVQRFADGTIAEGPYVNDEWNGHWVWRYPDGQVEEGPYVNGEQNGHWVVRFPSGQVAEGPFVNGQEHGEWVVRPPNGDTYTLVFNRGVRQER